MADYISADLVNGQFATGVTDTYQKENTIGTTSLGKDAFLQLLVTQLQYQDPLNPQSNTEFVSELAQFSSLEEMQNMTGTLSNSQALGLVGKNVVIEVGKSADVSSTTTVAGYVEYVKMVDGKAKLAINGELYDYADLEYVMDDAYLAGLVGGGNTNNNTNTDNNTSTENDKEQDVEKSEGTATEE